MYDTALNIKQSTLEPDINLIQNSTLVQMTNLVQKYDLPDIHVLESESNFGVTFWQPDNFYIILGRANCAEHSLHTQEVVNDGIKVYKRPTGGESVVLSPRMLVFSAKISSESLGKPKYIFHLINTKLIEELSKAGIKNLNSKGISDLSIGEKKILGSSMFLSGKTLFYHAVLNISEEISLISKYLKHPKREPDYRNGRAHDDFVTSIYKEGFIIDKELIKASIEKAFSNLFKELGSYMN